MPTTHWPQIITEAAKSPLGIVALVILVIGVIPPILFRGAPPSTKIRAYAFTLMTFIIFVFLAFRAYTNAATQQSAPVWERTWNGTDPDPSVRHNTGRQREHTWFVTDGDKEGTMRYGPYVVLGGGAGTYEAYWDLRLDEPCVTDKNVVTLTVYDSDRTLDLRKLDVPVTDWGGRVHEYIEAKISFVPLVSDLNHRYEFRTHWHGKCSLTLGQFGVRKM